MILDQFKFFFLVHLVHSVHVDIYSTYFLYRLSDHISQAGNTQEMKFLTEECLICENRKIEEMPGCVLFCIPKTPGHLRQKAECCLPDSQTPVKKECFLACKLLLPPLFLSHPLHPRKKISFLFRISLSCLNQFYSIQGIQVYFSMFLVWTFHKACFENCPLFNIPYKHSFLL